MGNFRGGNCELARDAAKPSSVRHHRCQLKSCGILAIELVAIALRGILAAVGQIEAIANLGNFRGGQKLEVSQQ